MEKICLKNQRIWFNKTILNDADPLVFSPDEWQRRGLVVGSAEGRGTTWFVQLPPMQAALRHYRRGGLFRKINKDYYWFTGWSKTRSYQEFQLLERLRSHDVNVPKPVAAQATRYGLLYRADLLSEKIPNARDLFSILQDRKLSETRYHSIGTEIRKMHHVGIHHADLNIHNILIDDSDQVWIIDFDKCVAKAGNSWKTNNLSRLLRSFRKEQKKRHIHWHEDSWGALQRGYES